MSEKDCLILGSAVVDLASACMAVSKGPDSIQKTEINRHYTINELMNTVMIINNSPYNVPYTDRPINN